MAVVAKIEKHISVKNMFVTSVKFSKRELPVKLVLPDRLDLNTKTSIPPELVDAEAVWRPMERRLNHVDVQASVLKLVQVKEDEIKELEISPKSAYEKEIAMESGGKLTICDELASSLRGDKTALVLNGGGPRGIMLHLGFINSLAKNKIQYDMIFGTSAGSVVGSLLAKHGDPNHVKFLIYKALSKYSVLELADLDTSKGLKMLELNGLLKGERILAVLRNELGLGDTKFSELPIPLFVPGVEMNTGKEYIFGDTNNVFDQLIEDPRTTEKGIDMKFVPKFFQGDIDVATAVRCSMSMPVIFRLTKVPGTVEYTKVPFNFTDGGVKENSPFKTAACFIPVRNILIGDPGYAGKMATPYSEQGLISILMSSMNLMMSVQSDALNDPVLNWPVRVRSVNFGYGAGEVGAAEAFKNAQTLKLIGELSTDAIFEKAPKEFWKVWPDNVFPRIKDGKFKRTRVDKLNQNTEVISYKISPLAAKTEDEINKLKEDDGHFKMKEASGWDTLGFYTKIGFEIIKSGFKNLFKKK